ncbi:hypothetical protein G6711_02780 [Polynucleobacter paneuropaeus]|nr:hypothetical protein [Polynucleobacter paneuropaeus]
MSNSKNNEWVQQFADNLNWNVLREHYEDNKSKDEFKSMTTTEVEQWFLEQVNQRRKEQGLDLKTIDDIKELLKLPYRIAT